MSKKKTRVQWEVINTLKYDESAFRTPCLQLSMKTPFDKSRSLNSNVSLTTGFWDKKQDKFCPTVHFQAEHFLGLTSMLIVAGNVIENLREDLARTAFLKPTTRPSQPSKPPEPKPKKLTASIGDMLKAKGN